MNQATQERPAITMMQVASSQIAAIGHCAETNVLAIQFLSKSGPGSIYHYQNFSATDYAAFAGAESIGSHFGKYIKNNVALPFEKISGLPAAPQPVAQPEPAPAVPTLTKEALAAILTGREYGDEISKAEQALAYDAGLLVIFGASDDLMEFRGAVYDEIGCYDGGTAKIDAQGLLQDRENIEDDAELKLFFVRQPGAKAIEALWAAEGTYSWTFKTDIPHATFEITEDGEPYCRGIVISMADLG